MSYRGPQKNPLIVLSDGSWKGRDAGSESNIYHLANLIWGGADLPKDDDRAHLHPTGTVHYTNSVPSCFHGLNTHDIAQQCIDTYKFLARRFTPQETEIWLFGVSRGAYIVRSVAGMINNCGIVKPLYQANGEIDDAKTYQLCQEVYRIYRDPSDAHAPKSEPSRQFRRMYSWPLVGDGQVLDSPVRFMGLFDTVGERGIPEFGGGRSGVSVDRPTFYDQHVSSVVSDVYHAVSLHDRLFASQPCLISRDTEYGPSYGITERWFPGTHYDVGRLRFKLVRDVLPPWLRALLLPAAGSGGCGGVWTSRTVRPNEVLTDLALKWMLECVGEHDPSGFVIPKGYLYRELDQLKLRIVSARDIGDGDVYDGIVRFAPFGRIVDFALSTAFGKWQESQVYQLLFAFRPRQIPEANASVYNYRNTDPDLDGRIIQKLAVLPVPGSRNRNGSGSSADPNKHVDARYPSTTCDQWLLRRHCL